MIARSLVKACALPLLALLLIFTSNLFGIFTSGVTQVVVWVKDSPESVRIKLADEPFSDPIYIQREPMPGPLTVLESDCDGNITKLTTEVPSYQFVIGGELDAWLAKSGMQVCTAPWSVTNQVPQHSSSLSRYLNGWQWLLASIISFGIVWVIYRKYGLPEREPGIILGLGPRVVVGFSAVGLLYGVNLLLLVWSGYELIPYSDIFDKFGDTWRSPAMYLSMSLAIPLIEETAFRAWLIPLASRSIGQAGAILLSIILFAAAHVHFDWPSMLFYLSAGAIFSLLWFWTRSLATCVLAHGVYNAIIIS